MLCESWNSQRSSVRYNPPYRAERGRVNECCDCARSEHTRNEPGYPIIFLEMKKPAGFHQQAFFVTRQRPTFPLPHSSSIIGLGGLNFRVRDGNGCGPSGNATGNFLRVLSSKFWVVSYNSALRTLNSTLTRLCARKTMSIRSKDDDVKPHDRLVLVSYSPHRPSTPSLSNS